MRLRLLLGVLAMALFAVAHPSYAATNATLGTYDTSGVARDVIVVGNYAYVADTGNGVLAVNISDPAHPTLSATRSFAGVMKVDAADYLLLAAGGSSLNLYNITDPAAPTQIGASITISNMTIGDVVVDGTRAYVTGIYNGTQPKLYVIDISNTSAPVVGASVDIHGVEDMTVAGNYVFIAGGRTVDIVNAYPIMTLAGTYTSPTTNASFQGIQVSGTSAYLNDTATGLTVLSISPASSPTLIGNYSGQYGLGIAVSNGYVFLGSYADGGMVIYDIATTGSPVYVNSLTGAGNAYGVTIANNIGVLADGNSGITIVDVVKPDTIAPVVTPNGAPVATVTFGSKYTDPGVTGTDNIGGDMSSRTTVSGKVDTNKVGKYVLTYTTTDRAGNSTSTKRTVYVPPVVSSITVSKNTFTLTVAKKKVVLRPFSGYLGAVVAKKIIVDTKTNPYYLFISTTTKKPELVVYDSAGKLVSRQALASISTAGIQVVLTANPVTLSTYVAIAPTITSMSVSVYNITKGSVKKLSTFTAAGGKGTIVMKFLKAYSEEYGLATLPKNTTKKPYVWRYGGGKKGWYQDKAFDLNRLSWTKTNITLK